MSANQNGTLVIIIATPAWILDVYQSRKCEECHVWSHHLDHLCDCESPILNLTPATKPQ
jgi:hypothetical protein